MNVWKVIWKGIRTNGIWTIGFNGIWAIRFKRVWRYLWWMCVTVYGYLWTVRFWGSGGRDFRLIAALGISVGRWIGCGKSIFDGIKVIGWLAGRTTVGSGVGVAWSDKRSRGKVTLRWTAVGWIRSRSWRGIKGSRSWSSIFGWSKSALSGSSWRLRVSIAVLGILFKALNENLKTVFELLFFLNFV